MPTDTQIEERAEVENWLAGPWVVVLFNDDWHSFDEVITQLQKATGCSLERAEQIAEEAHHQGRARAYEGTAQECKRVAAVLREIRLEVEAEPA
jgi:ATP-dependent Clp protease adapter protein ClpS